jgi:MFS family permease
MLGVTFGLQYYDKAALGSASAFGILKDLGLAVVTPDGKTSTTRYATAVAAFYYGYIAAVLPMALVFARFNLSYTAGIVVTLWGVVAILTVVVHNFPGLVVQRVFLGLLESGVSPCFVAIVALWYKPREQAVRMGYWYSACGIFSMFSGAINYGLGSAGGDHAWKNIYYFCGAVTIFWGLVLFFFLPSSPLTPGRLFNKDEAALLQRRFEENPFARDRRPFSYPQAKEALLDIKTWIYFLIAALLYLCNGPITGFGAIIIKSMGYSGVNSVALTIPGGAMTAVTIWLFCWLADKYGNRTLWFSASCVPVIVGAIVCWVAPWKPTVGPLIGYYLIAAFGAPYVLLLALASANTAGSTKKAVTNGVIFVGYNVGNIAAAYIVRTEEASIGYRTTWITVLASQVASCALMYLLRILWQRENRRRAGASTPSSEEEDKIVQRLEEYEDLTDRQISSFRYTL